MPRQALREPRDARACAFGYRDAALGAGIHVHMGSDAPGLHEKLEFGKLFNQSTGQVGALPVEDDNFSVFQAHR